ncbi:MAG: carbohydrate kinase [Muribaculaceae bacterium]|nr:carbohydrate kinase [Muribaculaceae bacterium]
MEKEKRFVVGLGEVLWDVFHDEKQLGGAPANFAYHAGQFLGMDNVVVVSALGNDALAEETIEALKARRLGYLLPRVPYPTGTVQVELDERRGHTFDIREDVAWDNIPFTDEVAEVARSCRAVCFGTLAQRNAASRSTIQRFLAATPPDCLKIFDINLRQHFYSREVIVESLRLCNILKINDEELETVAAMFGYADLDPEGCCRCLMDEYRLDMVVLTCGKLGSYVFSHDGTSFLDTPEVEVADTVGAGDSFTGTFVACLLLGKSIAEAHSTAVRVSAFVCTQHGAMPAYPASLLG